jgi:hypothetical protein
MTFDDGFASFKDQMKRSLNKMEVKNNSESDEESQEHHKDNTTIDNSSGDNKSKVISNFSNSNIKGKSTSK